MIVVRCLKRSLFGLIVTAVVAGALAGGTPAFAEAPFPEVRCSECRPWWQLGSAAAPAVLRPGQAKSEVQELTVSATGGEFILFEPAAFEKGEFFNEKGEPEFALFPFNAEAVVVQKGLEGLYGAGDVQVSGGPGDEEGTKPYVIAFTGALADQSLRPTVSRGFLSCVGAKGPRCRQNAKVKVSTMGRSDGRLIVTAANMGNADLSGAKTPVTIADKLPAGMTAVAIEGSVNPSIAAGTALKCSLAALSCTFTKSTATAPFESIAPYEEIRIFISVNLKNEAKSGEVNEVIASGGNARTVHTARPISVGNTPTPFGVEAYELTPEEEGGGIDTQAGSHPYQLTTTLNLSRDYEAMPCEEELEESVCHPPEATTPELTKDLVFKLPPGLVGNPTVFPQCPLVKFIRKEEGVNVCPNDTAMGVARIKIVYKTPFGFDVEKTLTVPVFNLTPSIGEPARFAFQAGPVPVYLDTSVRTGGDYGVTVRVSNITQTVTFLDSRVTFWGLPGDPRHDNARGWSCVGDGIFSSAYKYGVASVLPCSNTSQHTPPPFLELPTSCTGPLQTTVEADSWLREGSFASFGPSMLMPALDGCNALPFTPSISVVPDGEAASTPTGLTVGVHLPQEVSLDAEGLSESNVRNTTVALPVGVALNPSAGDGLQACSDVAEPGRPEGQVWLHSRAPVTCPEASKVATVEIHSPLLPNNLTGAVYLAQQNENPFGSLVALYLVAEDPVSGTLIKVAGEVVPDPVTGQLISTFKGTPQLPFEDLKIHFFGGERAPLGTPALCGSYTTTSSIEGWSANPPSTPSSTFQIVSGPNGTPCRNPLPFSPELTVGSTNIQAGVFTPFTTTMSRGDGNQNLQGIVLHMPPGVSGLLTGVKLCEEPQADEGLCGPESLIGETTVSVGLGGSPFSVKGGRVYITGPYEGAPFGLSIVNPAKAGPYDLEKNTPCDCVVVRAKIEVDPITAALTITTDNTGPFRIPTILGGIPLEIQHVNVLINRPGFTFNPTSCDPMSITGSLVSTQGAVQALSVPFQVTNCATLAFKPDFKVSTAGKTSRSKGASLDVKLAYPKAAFGSQANIAKVKVDLPKQLPSRLTTLQKACTDSVFNQNPAACQPASRVGTATATTPLIPVPLNGPAYFVSHGGAKFPELIVALSGYGVTVYLHGETFIDKAGITSSTFRTIPDVPVGSFELQLPQGSNSALAANGNLCTNKLVMPTAFTAQNGATIHQSTRISVAGCPKHRVKAGKHRKKKR